MPSSTTEIEGNAQFEETYSHLTSEEQPQEAFASYFENELNQYLTFHANANESEKDHLLAQNQIKKMTYFYIRLSDVIKSEKTKGNVDSEQKVFAHNVLITFMKEVSSKVDENKEAISELRRSFRNTVIQNRADFNK
jgi:hypothetical protein